MPSPEERLATLETLIVSELKHNNALLVDMKYRLLGEDGNSGLVGTLDEKIEKLQERIEALESLKSIGVGMWAMLVTLLLFLERGSEFVKNIFSIGK